MSTIPILTDDLYALRLAVVEFNQPAETPPLSLEETVRAAAQLLTQSAKENQPHDNAT